MAWELYETLVLQRTATAAEIKRSFRSLALKYHPDKGGDAEMFKKISHAYDVLSDPERRQQYHAMRGTCVDDAPGDRGFGPGGDLFSMFFGRGEAGAPGRARDTVIRLAAGLDEVYRRSVRAVPVERRRRCAPCSGSGGVGRGAACQRCRGVGRTTRVVPIVMGLAHEVSEPCPDCAGTGRFFKKGDVCQACGGARIVLDKKTFRVRLGESRYAFPGEGDEAVVSKDDFQAGDLYIYIEERDHPGFARRDQDLVIKRAVTLAQALRGFIARIEHLDSRYLWIRAGPGDISPASTVKRIAGEGMHRGGPGSLYIVFTIDFPIPESLDGPALAAILQNLQNARYRGDADYPSLLELSSGSEPPPAGELRDLQSTDPCTEDDDGNDTAGDDDAALPGCTTS